MGCSSSTTAAATDKLQNTLPVPAHEEIKALMERQKRCEEHLKSLCGGDPEKKRIAVIMSGGGWRAMTSTVAFLDGLSLCGLMDGVSFVAGVSGGSWALTQMMLGGADYNPFHSKSVENPWKYGNKFDKEKHCYEGLTQMRSEKIVTRAANIDHGFREAVGKLIKFVTDADLTFHRVLLVGEGTYMDRYSNFLAQDLQCWAIPDGRKNQRLGDKGKPMLSGDLPVVCVTASAKEEQGPKGRTQTWCDFTPFGARRYPPTIIPATPVDELVCEFDDHKTPHDVYAHDLMAVMGSAFELDERSVCNDMPKFIKFLWKLLDDPSATEPVLGELTRMFYGANKTKFGELRDAGLDFNIPLPSVLVSESGRNFDIVIVNDASFGIKGGEELKKAIDKQYIDFENMTPAQVAAPWDDPVKVLIPKSKGLPVLVYVLTLNETPSQNIVSAPEKIKADCAKVRQLVLEKVFPAVMELVKPGVKVDLSGHVKEHKELVKNAEKHDLYDDALQEAIKEGLVSKTLKNPFHLMRLIDDRIRKRWDGKEYPEQHLARLAEAMLDAALQHQQQAVLIDPSDGINKTLLDSLILRKLKDAESGKIEAEFFHTEFDEGGGQGISNFGMPEGICCSSVGCVG